MRNEGHLDSVSISAMLKMEVTIEHGRLAMRPKRLVDVSETLTAREAATVRRGEAQLKAGRSKPWRAVKNELDR